MVSLEKRIIIFYLYLYFFFFLISFSFHSIGLKLDFIYKRIVSLSFTFLLLIIIFIIYSSVLRCLLATLGFDRKLGLETANFVFTIAKIVSFSIAAKKNAPKNADTE